MSVYALYHQVKNCDLFMTHKDLLPTWAFGVNEKNNQFLAKKNQTVLPTGIALFVSSHLSSLYWMYSIVCVICKCRTLKVDSLLWMRKSVAKMTHNTKLPTRSNQIVCFDQIERQAFPDIQLDFLIIHHELIF